VLVCSSIFIFEQALKEMHVQVKSHKNWGDYFAFLGLEIPKMEHRDEQLLAAVKRSEACGYHGGGGGGGGGNKKRR
jgi:hypothetical protein